MSQPDKNSLLHWKNDATTQWIMQQLQRKFPALPPESLPPSWEMMHLGVGQQQVLAAIHRLCNVD